MQEATPANEEEEETLPGVEEVVPGGAAVAWLVNDGERDLFSVAFSSVFSLFLGSVSLSSVFFLFFSSFLSLSLSLVGSLSLRSSLSLSSLRVSLLFFSFGFLLYL